MNCSFESEKTCNFGGCEWKDKKCNPGCFQPPTVDQDFPTNPKEECYPPGQPGGPCIPSCKN